MWTLVYKRQINISHHLALDYESSSVDAHGHILTISITFSTNRLNPNNMIIDTIHLDKMIDRLGSDINGYMMTNNVRGNATIENFILLLKEKSNLIVQRENDKYHNDVRMLKLSISDESGRQFIYDI